MRGFDRVEHLADVVVAGDALNLKEGAGIVAAGGLGQGALKTQEERALREEDRKSRKRDVLHGVADIVAGAPIGQVGGDGSHTSNNVIEAALVHGTRKAMNGAEVQVTIV